jgi:hypothetical protein
MEPTSSAIAHIEEWLLKTAHIPDGGRSFTRGFVDRLSELGVPLWGVSLSLLTKHPEVLWRTIQWQESDGIKIIDRRYETLQEPFFTDSGGVADAGRSGYSRAAGGRGIAFSHLYRTGAARWDRLLRAGASIRQRPSCDAAQCAGHAGLFCGITAGKRLSFIPCRQIGDYCAF